MFNLESCDFCGDCLTNCQFMHFDKQGASQAFRELVEGRTEDWLNNCVTCFACNEYCEKDARPFDLICLRMEERGDYVPREVLAGARKRFESAGDFRAPQVGDTVVSLCTIHGVVPQSFQGRLFQGVNFVKGRHYFCNILFMHMGNWSLVRDGMQSVIDRYETIGAKRVVFAHDDCYTHIKLAEEAGLKIPFEAIHLYEYLVDVLEENREDISPLKMRVTYQRPCASRYTPEKELYLDRLFDLVGVERVKREFDGRSALCCGQDVRGMMPARNNMAKYQDMNIKDAVDHGAEVMAFLCPMCLDALGEKCRERGLTPYFVVDLCRLALGEIQPI